MLAGVLPRLYPQMLERAYAHQDAGLPVYILTAASQEMADLLAHVLAFDGGLGSRSEIVDGRYTGARRARSTTARARCSRCASWPSARGSTWRASYAYSDSESDLPMLRAVGHAVVVNPDAALRRIAARGGLGGDRARPPRPAPEAARGARRGHRRGVARAGRTRRSRQAPAVSRGPGRIRPCPRACAASA